MEAACLIASGLLVGLLAWTTKRRGDEALMTTAINKVYTTHGIGPLASGAKRISGKWAYDGSTK